MAFLTDSNRPQPPWQPPPTACLTAAGAASEAPSLLMHPCQGGMHIYGGRPLAEPPWSPPGPSAERQTGQGPGPAVRPRGPSHTAQVTEASWGICCLVPTVVSEADSGYNVVYRGSDCVGNGHLQGPPAAPAPLSPRSSGCTGPGASSRSSAAAPPSPSASPPPTAPRTRSASRTCAASRRPPPP